MVDFMKWALTDGQKFAAAARLRAAAAGGREARAGSAGEDQGSRLPVVWHARGPARTICCSRSARAPSRWSSSSIVVGHRLRALARSRCCRSQKFGFNFWRDATTWDPVGRASSARCPFIWGTLYSSVLALLIADADRARHRGLHLRAVPAPAPAAARLPDRAARRHPVDRLRPLGHLRAGAGRAHARDGDCRRALRQLPLFSGPPLGVGMLSAGAHPRDHGHPVHLVGRARGAQVGAASRSARARTRSAPRASRRSAPRSSTRAPASSAPSCSASAARSARRWP